MHQDFQAPPPVALNQPQPAAATTEVSPIRFEGESSMKAHYQAPSEEALIAATGGIRQQQPDIKVEEAKVAFEGQSTTRHDYQAPPLEKLLQFLGRPAYDEMAPPIPFEGESSMKAHYAAPSTEAVLAASSASLRHADLQASSQQTACFEGQSTMHQDFQVPPPVALNQPQLAAATTTVNPIRFEGESSMKDHYQAASEEALIAATGGKRQQQPDIKVEEAKVAFEGQSTMRHDYQAPPLEKLLQFLGRPAYDEMAPPIPFEGESSMKAHYAAPSTEAVLAASSASLRHADLQASSQQTARFEGQSTMHQDFQTPPPVALNQPQRAAATTAVSPIRFEGESSMKAHYQAPSEEALIAATGGIRQQQPDIKVEEAKVALEGQSTMRHDYQAPPLEKLFQFLGRPVCDEMAPPIPFEGESSMKAHYAAPSTEAVLAASSASLRHAVLQAASQQTARFEGQSTTHQDFQTTCVGLEPNPSRSPPALALARFEGGSTAHHDYGVPPLEDLRKLISGTSSGSRERKLPQTTFEGESSVRAHYRAPSADALKEASRSPYQGRRSSSAHADRSSVKFEASSTSRMDYRAPPPEFWQRERLDKDATASGPPAPVTGPFEGESSMKAHYQAPPPESLRMTPPVEPFSREPETAFARFEGGSTAHHDYGVPPLEDLRQLISGTSSGSRERKLPQTTFEGESSMRAHYRAPSADALKEASRSPYQGRRSSSAHADRSSVKFEASSTSRMDYRAPPPEFWQRERLDKDATASGPPAPVTGPFEGESSMKAHYQAPPPESLRITPPVEPFSREPVTAFARFEGGSTAHHDYGVPPLEDLRKLISGTSSGSRERKLPQTTFEGESSMRAHYRAPSADALKEASRSPYQGRRSSSAHADRSSVKFEASSTSRMDYRAPPPEFWQRERLDRDATASGPPAPVTGPFEGESSRKAWCNGAPFSGSGPFDCIDPLWRSEHSRPEMSESSKVDAETEQFSMRHFPAWAVVPRSFREAEEASQMPQMSQPPQGQTVDTADRFGEVAGNHASDEYDVGPSAEGPKASRYQPRQARQEKQVGTLDAQFSAHKYWLRDVLQIPAD